MRELTKEIGKWRKDLPVIASNGYIGIVNLEEDYWGEVYVRTTTNNRWKKVYHNLDSSYFMEHGRRENLNDYIRTDFGK